MNYKQAIVLRKDLKMSCGKACAQSAHASIEAIKFATGKAVDMWEEEGYRKVVLAAHSKEEIEKLSMSCAAWGIPRAIIEDFGLTQLEPGTITAIGIGPAREEYIDKVVGHLKLY